MDHLCDSFSVEMKESLKQARKKKRRRNGSLDFKVDLGGGLDFERMGKYSWVAKELFLILFAPIFWALLTNFGRLWRYVDDKYYHKAARDWRRDRKKAADLHWELTHEMEFLDYHLGRKNDAPEDDTGDGIELTERTGFQYKVGDRVSATTPSFETRQIGFITKLVENRAVPTYEVTFDDDNVETIEESSVHLLGDNRKKLEMKTDDDDAETVEESSVHLLGDNRKELEMKTDDDNVETVEESSVHLIGDNRKKLEMKTDDDDAETVEESSVHLIGDNRKKLEMNTNDEDSVGNVEEEKVYEVHDVDLILEDVDHTNFSEKVDRKAVEHPPGSELGPRTSESHGVNEVHHKWGSVWNGKNGIMETISSEIEKASGSANNGVIKGSKKAPQRVEYNSDYIDDDY